MLQDAGACCPRHQQAAVQDRRSGKRLLAALPGTEARGDAAPRRRRPGGAAASSPPAGWRSGGAAARPGMKAAPPPPPPPRQPPSGKQKAARKSPAFASGKPAATPSLPAPLGKFVRLLSPGPAGHPPAPPDPAAVFTATRCHSLSRKPLSDLTTPGAPGEPPPCPGQGAPLAAVSRREGAATVGATAPPSPSPYRFPPWAGAPSALKCNLADLAVLSPGQPGVHLAWPGRESLGAPELGKG